MKPTPKNPKTPPLRGKAGTSREKPVKAKRSGKAGHFSESQLQASFFKWFRLQYPNKFYSCFAIPNGGKRDVVTAARMKAEGATAGVWDVLILNNAAFETSRGLFIEFKVGKNKLTEHQQSFREANPYYDFAICYTLEEAVKVVNAFLTT